MSAAEIADSVNLSNVGRVSTRIMSYIPPTTSFTCINQSSLSTSNSLSAGFPLIMSKPSYFVLQIHDAMLLFCITTSLIVCARAFTFEKSDVALLCGSPSINNTFFLNSCVNMYARLITVVDFPTPPFKLPTTITTAI